MEWPSRGLRRRGGGRDGHRAHARRRHRRQRARAPSTRVRLAAMAATSSPSRPQHLPAGRFARREPGTSYVWDGADARPCRRPHARRRLARAHSGRAGAALRPRGAGGLVRDALRPVRVPRVPRRGRASGRPFRRRRRRLGPAARATFRVAVRPLVFGLRQQRRKASERARDGGTSLLRQLWERGGCARSPSARHRHARLLLDGVTKGSAEGRAVALRRDAGAGLPRDLVRSASRAATRAYAALSEGAFRDRDHTG